MKTEIIKTNEEEYLSLSNAITDIVRHLFIGDEILEILVYGINKSLLLPQTIKKDVEAGQAINSEKKIVVQPPFTKSELSSLIYEVYDSTTDNHIRLECLKLLMNFTNKI